MLRGLVQGDWLPRDDESGAGGGSAYRLRAWLQDWADAVRRNHGLEHATVTVLLAKRGPVRLAGRAAVDGFYIVGDVDEDLLEQCAREALARMQRGETALAISPLCGTNIAVTGALTAALAMGSLARTGARSFRERYSNAFTAAMVGAVLAQPIGRYVQKHLTTRSDVQYVEVVDTLTLLPGVKKVYTSGARYRTDPSGHPA